MSPAVERVLALVSGLSPHARDRRLMMLLQSFADDSGSDARSHTFVLGGVVAMPTEWVSFTQAWEVALEHPIKLDYFKMSEAMSLNGQFSPRRGWAEAMRDEKISELIGITTRHVRYAAWASMRQVDFQKYIASIPLPMRTLSTDTPHMFLLNQFMLMLCEHAKRHRADCSFEFVFDEQLGVDREMALWWPHLKAFAATKGLSPYLGAAPSFRDEKQMLPLQAADLLAWEHRSHQIKNRFLVVRPSAFLRRLNAIPTIHVTFTEEALASMNDVLFSMSTEYAKQNPAVQMLAAGKKYRRMGKSSRSKAVRKAFSLRGKSS